LTTNNSECLFCEKKLRLDTRTGKLTQKGGFMRLYCDDCDIVFVISIHGKYHPKTSIIESTEQGEFKSHYDLLRGFSTKTRVLKDKSLATTKYLNNRVLKQKHEDLTWIGNISEIELRNKKEKYY